MYLDQYPGQVWGLELNFKYFKPKQPKRDSATKPISWFCRVGIPAHLPRHIEKGRMMIGVLGGKVK